MAAAAGLAVGVGVSGAGAQIYFAELFNPDPTAGAIRRANFDGSGLVTLVDTGGGLRGFAIDTGAGRAYWADADLHAIRRGNLDGTGIQNLVTQNVDFPSALRLDLGAGRVYWGDQTRAELRRANLNGGQRTLITTTPFYRGLALDSGHGKIYWTTTITSTEGRIVRANLDGTGLETIAAGAPGATFRPAAVALDVAAAKLYWTDNVLGVVRRADLDGQNQETLYADPIARPTRGIALDLGAGKVYWGQDTDFKGGPFGAVMRMNLDGSASEEVVGGLGLVQDLLIVPAPPPPGPCYANCDGSTTQPVLTINDFVCFINRFVANDPYANCDGSTAEPVLNVLDFLCFLRAFGEGCP
jgi:hypothetical protein